jgi:Tfp pilus assembly protein FimT
MSKNFHKNKYNFGLARRQGGVTLVELVVVIFIFMILTSITIFNYGKFRSSLSIQNLADDIALSIRRAQGFAIGVRGTGGTFTPGYGIHFTAKSDTAKYKGSNKSFILFVDMDTIPNKKYDYDSSGVCGNPTVGNECLELLSITSADNIDSIFLNDYATSISSSDTVDILFKRPIPEPIFCHRYLGLGSCDPAPISSIKIRISTDADPSIYKSITIFNNGQINVSGSI